MKKNELHEFFTKNNHAGCKTKEVMLMKSHPEIHNDIIKYCEALPFGNNLTFKEKIWYFINGCINIIKCPVCDKNIKFGRSIQEGYNSYCSIKCTNASKDHIFNVMATNNERYGGNSPFSSALVRDKAEQTNISNFGVNNIMKLDSVKDKFKNGTIKKYGVPYFFQSEKYKNTSSVKYKDLGLVNTEKGVFTIFCKKCNTEHGIDINLFYYRKRNKINLCPVCAPIKTFVKQHELFTFIQELLPEKKISKNNRKAIKPKEIDVYIPDDKVGFEFNGLYWHSSIFVKPESHQDKQERSELAGIKLFQIFEDEWDEKQYIVKSMIRNILKINKNRIHARNCIVKIIPTDIATIFLNNTHLQGYARCKIKLGLFYENELVSVMTFNKPRIITGGWKNQDGTFEIIRFASKLDTTINGGAGKLLSYFVKEYKPIKIISYADRRFSTGNVYKSLGFTFKHYTQPNYYYLINNKRVHRFNFNKQILIKMGYDPAKTERQIMEENKIYKIFDCGSLLFEKYF